MGITTFLLCLRRSMEHRRQARSLHTVGLSSMPAPAPPAGGMYDEALAVLQAGTAARKLRDPLGVKEQQVGAAGSWGLGGTHWCPGRRAAV